MILPLPKRPPKSEDNILPLINIVFLLLIFFMLAGSLNSRPPFPVALPETANAGGIEPSTEIISIAADGRLALGAEAITEAQLPKRLSSRDKNQPLQIKADAELPASRLTALLKTLRGAGIAQVRILSVHQP